MGSRLKVGVYGGTFDPVHLGHLIVAEEVRQRLGFDRVLFCPAARPWMKWHRAITPAPHRLAMLKLALASNPCFHISTVDLEHSGPSFTVNTLRALRAELGESAELYFMLGVDSLRELPQWREPQNIVAYGKLVAMARPGCEEPEWERLEQAIPTARNDIAFVRGPLIDISSTDIRRRVAEGLSIRYLVPEAVEKYIHEHGLYKGEPDTVN